MDFKTSYRQKKVFLLSLFVFSFGLLEKDSSFEEKKKLLFPETSFENSFYNFYDIKTGILNFILVAEQSQFYSETNEIWLSSLKLLHYYIQDSSDKYLEITAEKGKFNTKNMNFEAIENVQIVVLNETRIESDHIYWNYEKQELKSKKESAVVLYRKNFKKEENKTDIIRINGKNLIYNFQNGNIEIENAVSMTDKDIINKKE